MYILSVQVHTTESTPKICTTYVTGRWATHDDHEKLPSRFHVMSLIFNTCHLFTAHHPLPAHIIRPECATHKLAERWYNQQAPEASIAANFLKRHNIKTYQEPKTPHPPPRSRPADCAEDLISPFCWHETLVDPVRADDTDTDMLTHTWAGRRMHDKITETRDTAHNLFAKQNYAGTVLLSWLHLSSLWPAETKPVRGIVKPSYHGKAVTFPHQLQAPLAF
ncbi:hypothetical protein V8F06_006068 [Rhypophila decipiens]